MSSLPTFVIMISTLTILYHLKQILTPFRPDADSEEVQVLGSSHVQATVVVLAGHQPRLPQHMHSGRGALQPARVADRLSL